MQWQYRYKILIPYFQTASFQQVGFIPNPIQAALLCLKYNPVYFFLGFPILGSSHKGSCGFSVGHFRKLFVEEPSPRHSVGLDWYDINLDNILPFCDTYFYCKAPTFLWKGEICHSSMVLVSVASACIAQLCPSSDFVWAHCVFRPID